MRGVSRIALLGASICAVSVLFLAFLSSEASGGYVEGDWDITTDTTITNETWTVNGSITISAGTLYLRGAELVLAYDQAVVRNLVVEEGAALMCEGSVIRLANWYHGLIVHGNVTARNTTVFLDRGDGWMGTVQILQHNGSIKLDRCDLYCYIRTYRNATITNSTVHVDNVGISVPHDPLFTEPRSVVLSNTTFHGMFQTHGIWVWGPYNDESNLTVIVSNCTFHDLTYAIRVYNFLDSGRLVLEDNVVHNSSIGAVLRGVGSSLVCRRNLWMAYCGMEIEAVGTGSPNISDETIYSPYYGIRISVWPIPMRMSNISISSNQTAIRKSGATLSLFNSSINGTEVDFEVRSGVLRIDDCSHNYRSRMLSDTSYLYDYRSVEIASVGWKGGPSITEGTTWFYDDKNETVTSMSNSALSTLVIKHWQISYLEERICHEFYCRFKADGWAFQTGRYPVLGASPVDIVFIDDSYPVLRILSPLPGSYHNQRILVVEGTCEEKGSGIRSIKVSAGGGPWTNATLDGKDRWTAALGPLPDGGFTIVVNITDMVDNAGAWTVVDVTVDTTAPPIIVIEPGPWTNVVYCNLVVQTEVGSVAYVNGMGVEVSPLGVFTKELHLSSGISSVYIRVVDLAGNANETRYSITHDREPPPLLVTFPVDRGWIGSVPFEVRGFSEEDAVVFVGDIEAARDGTAFFVVWIAHEGPITFAITATDRAGNTAHARVSATVDLTPPELCLEIPFETINTSVSPLIISGTASDNYNLRVTVNGTEVGVIDGAWSASVYLMMGRQRIDIKVEDAAGHSDVISRYVVYDPIPPSMSVTLELGRKTFQDTFEGIRTNETLGRILVILDEECTINIAGWGVYRSSNDRTTILVNLTENALNELSIHATDIVGNRARPVVFLVTVDTKAPPLAVIEPIQGAVVHQGAIQIHIRTEPLAILHVRGNEHSLDLHGELLEELPLEEGRNEIEVVAFDEVGNRANLTLVVLYLPVEEGRTDETTAPIVLNLVAIASIIIAVGLVQRWWKGRV